jgi:hypothetical protein
MVVLRDVKEGRASPILLQSTCGVLEGPVSSLSLRNRTPVPTHPRPGLLRIGQAWVLVARCSFSTNTVGSAHSVIAALHYFGSPWLARLAPGPVGNDERRRRHAAPGPPTRRRLSSERTAESGPGLAPGHAAKEPRSQAIWQILGQGAALGVMRTSFP